MLNKIALVDDDQNILTSVSLALESEGFIVDKYQDGEQGLNGIKRRPPDLLVLDIKMPKLDGMEVLERLRKQSNLPVIFLTSKDDEVDEALGLRIGADDYIKKPFSQRLLIERIKALLRRVNISNEIDPEALITRGDLVMDTSRHSSKWKGD
ncbi:MAG: response regulator, partial [Candidatus Puniceispirillales bacterium]